MQLNVTNITNDTVLSNPLEAAIHDFIHNNRPYVRIVTCSLAVLTNILVVITVARSRKSWKYSTHILILTLACADIAYNSLELVKEILNNILSHIPVDNFEIYFSVLYYTWIVGMILLPISNYMIILISLNRCVLVCKPFSHHRITSRRSTLKQIVAVSTIFTILGLLNIIDIGHMHGVCTIFKITAVVYVFLSYIVPLTVSVVLTILVLREFRQNRSTLNKPVNTRTEIQGEKNITKAMIAVIVAFILLTLLHAVSYTLYKFNVCMFEANVNLFLNTLAADNVLSIWRDVNFSINIFIYTVYIPKFRVALLNVFKCKWRHQKNGRRDPPEDNQRQNIRRNPNYQIT